MLTDSTYCQVHQDSVYLLWISDFMEKCCQVANDKLGVWDPIVEEKSCWEPWASTHMEFKFKLRVLGGEMEVKLS